MIMYICQENNIHIDGDEEEHVVNSSMVTIELC